jgi:hypothetical protein
VTDAVHGITLSVGNVAYGEGTMSLEMAWENNSTWKLGGGQWPDYVVDQDNHFAQQDYQMVALDLTRHREQSPDDPVPPMTLSFTNVSPHAEILTMMVSRISVMTDSAPLPITFTVNLGDAPVHEQTYPMSKSFSIAGFDYELREARFMMVDEINDPQLFYLLPDYPAVLLITIAGDRRHGDLIQSTVKMESVHGSFRGFGEEQTESVDGKHQWYTVLAFADVPTGQVPVRIESVHYALRGPWRVTWRVPEDAASSSTIRSDEPAPSTPYRPHGR